ncbi:MAG: hypothetical protein ACOCUI_04580, partial [bacterium]
RKMGMEAIKGRGEMSEGINALRTAGRATIDEATESTKGWWILLIVILALTIILGIISYFI